MVSKTRYTEEYRKKVVEESRNGRLTLDVIAAKYGLPSTLLKYRIENDRLKTFASH